MSKPRGASLLENAFLIPGLAKMINEEAYCAQGCRGDGGAFKLSFYGFAADGMVLNENQIAGNLNLFLMLLIIDLD